MILIDSDIFMDLFWKRKRFWEHASELIEYSRNSDETFFTTSIILANLHYLASKNNSPELATKYCSKILDILAFRPNKMIDFKNAYASKFKDKEDAVNYFTTISNNGTAIITRNIRDFKESKILVMTAQEYLQRVKAN